MELDDDEARLAERKRQYRERIARRDGLAVRAQAVEDTLRELQLDLEHRGDPATRARRRQLIRGIRVGAYLLSEKYEPGEVRRLLEAELRE
ncbi:hypothetical protein D9M69_662250 [compost metagenome]